MTAPETFGALWREGFAEGQRRAAERIEQLTAALKAVEWCGGRGRTCPACLWPREASYPDEPTGHGAGCILDAALNPAPDPAAPADIIGPRPAADEAPPPMSTACMAEAAWATSQAANFWEHYAALAHRRCDGHAGAPEADPRPACACPNHRPRVVG